MHAYSQAIFLHEKEVTNTRQKPNTSIEQTTGIYIKTLTLADGDKGQIENKSDREVSLSVGSHCIQMKKISCYHLIHSLLPYVVD